MPDDISVKLTADAKELLKSLDAAISKIAQLRDISPALATVLGKVEGQMTKLAGSLRAGTGDLTKQAKAVETLTSQYQKLGLASVKGADRVSKELQSNLKLQQDLAKQSQAGAYNSYGPNIAASSAIKKQYDEQVNYARDANKRMIQEEKTGREAELSALRNAIIERSNAQRKAGDAQLSYAQQANKQRVSNEQSARQSELNALRSSIIERNRLQDQSAKAQISYAAQATRAGKSYGQALLTENTALANQRYALYDVATSFTAVSVATLGAVVAATAVGISYQKAFATVQRTSQASGAELAHLRDQLINLSMSIPLSFEEISNIAALGGQLGIAASGLDEFTSVVAKLVATTNLSSEAAGTALGRFDALFKDIDPSKFEALGSAILKVGVNSVATETQIVNTATQISSMGEFAGLTAEQVVGLSGALASVGAQPELSRGTITRVFTQMSKAVAAGGDSLDEFARVSNVSSAEFQSAWGTDRFAAVFQKFLAGIGNEGQTAITTLNDLGISSVRDIPLLLRLAGAQDVVTTAFADAKSGFNDATELNKQYAITLDTVAAQLTIFGNTLKAILDNVGGAALGPLSGVLGVFQSLAAGLVAIGNTGAGKVIGVTILALTGLVGVMTALRAVQALSIASAYAFTTAQAALGAEGLKSAGSIGGLARQMAAVTIGTTRATAATTAYNAAVAEGSGRVGAFGAGVKGAVTGVNGLAGALRSAAVAGGWLAAIGLGISLLTAYAQKQQEAKVQVDSLTASLDAQTGALTGLTTQQTFADLNANGTIEKAKALGLNLETVTQAALGNKSAIAELVAIQGKYQAALQSAQDTGTYYNLSNDKLKKGLSDIGLVLESVGVHAQNVADAQQAFGDAAKAGAGALDEQGAAAQDLIGDLQAVLDTQYDLVGGTVAVQNAIYGLGSSLGENGNDFSAYSVAGRANLAALQQALSAMVTASGGDAQALAVMIAGLMQTLAAQGVDTVNQLGFVQNALAQLTGGKGVGGLTGVNDAAAQAANALGQGFSVGANKAAKAAKSAGKGAKDAAKDIKTLSDYVSDLSGVFKTAFDIRFGLEQSLDSVAEGWQKMADSAEEARNSIADATQELIDSDATIQGLNAANTTLNYQLVVAQQYGDVLRANEILAEMAQNNADISDEQKKRVKSEKDLTKAQQAAIPSLDAQTEGSREQRDMVLGLVKSYQDQVSALANTGLSQQEVARRTQELKNQFISQLTQMGYNRAEIDRYAASFDDLTTAILNVPRNITVNADTNPAQRAIDEFLAKNQNRSLGVGTSVSGDGYGAGVANGNAYAAGWVAAVNAGRRIVSAVDNNVPGGRVYRTVDNNGNYGPLFFNKGGSVAYRASGGGMGHPGGPKGTDTIPAWLSPGEFVMQKSAVQSMGLPFMNALNNQQAPRYLAAGGSAGRGGGSGAPMIQLVELLPNQMQQLAEMVSTSLSLDGRIVAEATNNVNASSARRGSA